MRPLVPLLACLVLPLASARATTVRVAVASGPSLTITGHDLVARSSPDAPAIAFGRRVRLTSVGPFVSDGQLLTPTLSVADRSGARLEVGGVGLLGAVEVVATDRTLYAIDRVELETYVASVVGGEMPPSWPMQALEAQAIAARTYVLARRLAATHAPYDVDAGVLSQVYRGAGSLDPRTVAAAQATKGVVVTWHGALADTYFFASCTGRTESARAAFGTAAPYLVPTSCQGGEGAPLAHWTRRLTIGPLSRALEKAGAIGGRLRGIVVTRRTKTGRIARARLVTGRGARVVRGAELRRLVGYSALPSLDATVAMDGGEVVFTGSGSGHGVGLCQWCARGRALAGDSAARILARAYPGTRLSPLP